MFAMWLLEKTFVLSVTQSDLKTLGMFFENFTQMLVKRDSTYLFEQLH